MSSAALTFTVTQTADGWCSVPEAPVLLRVYLSAPVLLRVYLQGKFLRSALAHSHLRSNFKAHVGTAAVGMVCFAYEDVATNRGWPPVLHSLWHCLSAFAMGAVHGLLEHLELAVLVEGLQLEAS